MNNEKEIKETIERIINDKETELLIKNDLKGNKIIEYRIENKEGIESILIIKKRKEKNENPFAEDQLYNFVKEYAEERIEEEIDYTMKNGY